MSFFCHPQGVALGCLITALQVETDLRRLTAWPTRRVATAICQLRDFASRPRAAAGTMPDMSIVFPVLGVALAATCVWLTVRIINRRERWAKRTAVAMVLVLVVYPLSIGPAGWLNTRVLGPSGRFNDVCLVIYAPLLILYESGPPALRDALHQYDRLWGLN
jgi:hypothetical protein